MRRTALIATLMTASLLWLSATVHANPADETEAESLPPAFVDAEAHGSAEVEAVVAETAAAPEPPASESESVPAEKKPLDNEMEDVKKALIKLKRDLVILEEDLLFPASSQVSVFLSMDLGEFFQLDAVVLKLNGKEVASHLYTDRQVDALYRGGVQKVFVGNVKQGDNTLTAFFTGRGPNGRDYRRATTVDFEKSFEPTFVELAISDSTAKYQPEFRAAVSN